MSTSDDNILEGEVNKMLDYEEMKSIIIDGETFRYKFEKDHLKSGLVRIYGKSLGNSEEKGYLVDQIYDERGLRNYLSEFSSNKKYSKDHPFLGFFRKAKTQHSREFGYNGGPNKDWEEIKKRTGL